jgi:hypothetical protein
LTDKNIDRLIREWKLVKIKDSDYYKINGPQVHESRRYLTPNIKKILETIAKEFYKKFKKPLIINSLARTQEYQNTLNKSNKNATKSISAHTYWIAFDIKIKEYLTLEEANYICYILLKMEEEWKINWIIEWGATMCFHITDLL